MAISLKHVLALMFLAALCSLPLAAWADDLVLSRSVLEDPTGRLTIDDVTTRAFTPAGPEFSKGFSDSAHWFRLQVRAPAQGAEVVLRIHPPFLNEVRLYEPANDTAEGWQTRVTGSHHAYKTRDRLRSTLSFVVRVPPPGATYYLRLKTRSASQLSVEALPPDQADEKDHRSDLLEVFFTTAMLSLLLWAIHSYLQDRLKVVGFFVWHQLVYLLFALAMTGYLAPYAPQNLPKLVDWVTALLYCGINLTILLFCRELFQPYRPPRLLMRGLDLLLLAFPLEIAAMALGHLQFAVTLNALLLRGAWLFYLVVAFSLRKELSPSRRMLQLFFLALTLSFPMLSFLGRATATSGSGLLNGKHVLFANGIVMGLLFAMILNARSRKLLQEAKQSALELQAKSEFLALVSHEIRTPLNALVGFSALARQASDPAKLNRHLSILEQSSQSLMELVNDILDVSKVQAGRLEFQSVPFDLRQLLESLEEQYRPLAEGKTLAFRMEVAEKVPAWVLGDPVRLRQILANLLSNAVKFTEKGGFSCAVTPAERPPGRGGPLLRFEVQDTGIGITPDNQALLFQPFRQVDATISRTYGGSGLGLAIVRGLAEQMQGSVTVQSSQGVGSSFAVELPLPDSAPEPAAGKSAPVPAPVPAPGSVLVVEDNRYNRGLFEDILTSWGQEVILAEDGWQALQRLDERSFDLVLLDIRMPGMDGTELARRIRGREQERAAPPLPIIAVTAEADAATHAACLDCGIDVVLTKPVIPEKLFRAIAEQRAKTAPSGDRPLLSAGTRRDLGDDPDRARRYRELLMQDIDDELQYLLAALEREDTVSLKRAAHTLKGLCGHLANGEPVQLAAWLAHEACAAPPQQMRRVAERLRTLCQGSAATGPSGRREEPGSPRPCPEAS